MKLNFYVLFLLLSLCVTNNLFAVDKVWTGSTSNNWSTASNWSPSGVPTSSDVVYINDVTNDPVISSGTVARAKGITITSGALLTINSGATLTVSANLSGTSIIDLNGGTLTNNGTLSVTNAASDSFGLVAYKNGTLNNTGTLTASSDLGSLYIGGGNTTLTNSSTGVINLQDGVGIRSVANTSGTFSNQGTINFTGQNGFALALDPNFTFTNSGLLDVTAGYGIYVNSATVTNSDCGRIKLSAQGYQNFGTTTNAGLIQIDASLDNTGGSFINNGLLKYASLTGNAVVNTTNSSIIVNDTPTPIFTYGAPYNGTVNGIYTNATATTSAGTFTAPNAFTPSGLPNGSQTLYAKITPSGGACTYVVPFTYNYIAPPAFTAEPTSQSVCTGSSTTFTVAASGGTSYQWQVNTGNGDGFTNLSNTTPYSGVTGTTLTISNVAGLNTYQYRCVALGDGGSTNSTAATLTVHPLPSAIILTPASTTITCSTSSLSLTATGGGTYHWDDNITTAIRSVTTAGTYSVTVTSPNGCTAVDTQVITSATATVTVINPTTTTATQGTFFNQTFTASGGVTPRSFSLASGSLPNDLSLNATTGVVSGTPTQSGSFTIGVRATDANGCSGVGPTYVLTVSNATPIIADFSANPDPLCVGKVVTFNATVGNVSGSYAYTLTNGTSTTTGTSSNTAFSQSLTTTSSGIQTYTLIVSSNGQSAMETYDLTVNAPPTPTLTASNGDGVSTSTLTCDQTTITLNADGGDDYLFSGPGILSQDTGNGRAVVNAAGVYSVTVTNSETGCFSTTTTTVSSNTTAPLVSISPTSATLTCASPTVSLSVIGSGTIEWSTGESTASISVSTAATYSVRLTNAGGCSSTASVSVSSNQTAPSVSINPSSTTLSNVSPTVSLTAVGTGTFRWSTGATTQVISVTASGTYSVTLTSPGGCTASASVPVAGSDLTINLDLPQANFAASGMAAVGNFVVNVFEVGGLPTSSGNVTITVTAPIGYTLSFAGSLTSINVSGGEHNPVAVDNGQWTVSQSVGARQLTLTMNSGAFISGSGESSLGFSITRTSANSGSTANITVNVKDDLTMGYDSNLNNNVYARVISGL